MSQLSTVKQLHVSTNVESSQRQYLTFISVGELFAIPIENIREINELNELTSVPLMPNFLRGVINLRGAVVPVIDLSVRFSRAETEIKKRTCVVIIELEYDGHLHALGIMVDAVNEVITIDRSQLEKKPHFGTNIRSDFIAGILNVNGKFIIALDVGQVMSFEEISSLAALAGNSDHHLIA